METFQPHILLVDPSLEQAKLFEEQLPSCTVTHVLDIFSIERSQDSIDWNLIVFALEKDSPLLGDKKLQKLIDQNSSRLPVVLAVSGEDVYRAARIPRIFGYILRPYILEELSTLVNTIRTISRNRFEPQGHHSSSEGKTAAVTQLAQRLTNIDNSQLLSESMKALSDLAQADYCFLLRFNNRINKLTTIASCGASINHQAIPVIGMFKSAFEKNILARCSRSSGGRDQINELESLSQLFNIDPVENCLVIPLARRDDVFGIVIVAQKVAPHGQEFYFEELDFLNAVISQIVEHMERNSQSHALQSLLDVSTRVISTPNENEVLNLITNLLVEKLNYRVAYLRFLLPDKRLRIFSTAGATENYAHNPTFDLPEGVGISNYVLKTRKPVTIYDVRSIGPDLPDFHFRNIIEKEHLRGLLSVPVTLDQREIGTLSCYTGRPCKFNDADIQLVETFANLAAAAFSNSKSFKTLQELEKVGQILSSKVETDEVLRAIVENIPTHVYADGAFVCPYDSRNNRLLFKRSVSIGLGHGLVAWDRDKQHTYLLNAFLEQPTLIVPDVASPSSELLMEPETCQLLKKANISSFIGLRLEIQEGEPPLGLLFVNYKFPITVSQLEEVSRILHIYGDQAALNIKRAQEYERIVTERQLLSSLALATGELREVKETCQKILEGAVRIIGAERGNISRIYPGTDLLRDVAQYGPIWVDEPQDLLVSETRTEGIQGWVAIHKEPALIHDVRHPKWKDQYVVGNPETVSELTVPILDKSSDKLIGVINLESSQEAAFDENDLDLLYTLAIHAAIAIQTAEKSEHLSRYLNVIKALQTSIVLTKNSIERTSMLQTILRHAAEITNAHFATIQKVSGNKLFFEAVYPASHWKSMHTRLGEYLPMDGPGITVKVAQTGIPFYSKDISSPEHKDLYVDGGLGVSLSELAVPLRYKDEIWGVINVEAEQANAFDEEDMDALEALGTIAVTALISAKYAMELSRTNSLAVMGAWGAEVTHDINRAVGNIRRAIHIIKNEIEISEKAGIKFEEIENNLVKLKMPAMPNSLFQSEAPENLKAFLDGIVENVVQVYRNEFSERIEFITELNCDNLFVVIDPNWLVRLLQHLINNGIQAIDSHGKITLSTWVEEKFGVIRVSDNGIGIPEDVQRSLFLSSIYHKGENRSGSGLLLVGYIAEQYGGSCQLVHSKLGYGSEFELKLPFYGSRLA